jgi:late competence protein required for DNA uptake (superfamily II DNA/RNA helicase)
MAGEMIKPVNDDFRKNIVELFLTGKLRCNTSTDILTDGFIVPKLGCVVIGVFPIYKIES